MLYRLYLKRILDIIAVVLLFVVLLPIIILVLLLLMINNLGSPLFFQTRPGKGGRLFRVIKFKTMNEAKDSSGNLLPDDQRLTLLGNLIRKTSLDEIPQLVNVLKGDMSLIGPRPLLVEYLPLYSGLQARRHDIKPGITGWAQVNGRNLVNWKERFEMDVWYVENVSFLLDLKIVYWTIYKIFKSEGISSHNSVTMEKFKGN